MKPAKLSTNFVPYTDADFKLKAANILESMESNPHFPDPIPTLESIRILYLAYSEALLKAATMDRIAIAQKNDARKKLAHELARLSLYIMYIADGKEAILASSGFTITKTPEAAVISAPNAVNIKNGVTSGQLVSSVKAVKGAKTYIHEIAIDNPADNTGWESYPCSRRSYTFSNLTPGKHYYIRIVALGTGNQRTCSPIAEKWVQ